MTHQEIDSMTDGQVAQAVAKAMGWRLHFDPKYKDCLVGYVKDDGNWCYGNENSISVHDFKPCTDANDDLIVLQTYGNERGNRQRFRHYCRLIWGNRRIGCDKGLGGRVAYWMYQPGDYSRALLHAQLLDHLEWRARIAELKNLQAILADTGEGEG